MRLTLHTFLTLDGVMQAPGGKEEDRSGHFSHGGWMAAHASEDGGEQMVEWFGHASAFLLGRHTYDIFSGYWPQHNEPGDPIANPLNDLPKYVASSTLRDPAWANTTVLEGDVAAAVRQLKEQPGDELQVHGSGGLAQTLIDNDLVDEYRLLTFPLHLGSGKKLFRDGATAASLELVSSKTTSRGCIIATYRPAGPVVYGEIGVGD